MELMHALDEDRDGGEEAEARHARADTEASSVLASNTELCSAILHLTQRLSTDEQYASHDKIKDLSLTIQDNMQKYLSTPAYIQVYNKVKQEIGHKRSERKQKEKRLVATEAGLQQRQRKREKKQEKKKEKRINKIILNKLNR